MTSEETQAAIYAELVRYVVCDADVAQLNFFGYYDEPTRLGWQAALRRTDGSERASHAAVAAAIAETGGECWGPPRTWQPLRKPERAAVTFTGRRRHPGGHATPLVRSHRSRGGDRDGRESSLPRFPTTLFRHCSPRWGRPTRNVASSSA